MGVLQSEKGRFDCKKVKCKILRRLWHFTDKRVGYGQKASFSGSIRMKAIVFLNQLINQGNC